MRCDWKWRCAMLIKENIIYSIKIQKTNVLGVAFLFYAFWNLLSCKKKNWVVSILFIHPSLFSQVLLTWTQAYASRDHAWKHAQTPHPVRSVEAGSFQNPHWQTGCRNSLEGWEGDKKNCKILLLPVGALTCSTCHLYVKLQTTSCREVLQPKLNLRASTSSLSYRLLLKPDPFPVLLDAV